MAHFPVFIDLTARKCMIFGGGKVALRKVENLLKYKADVEVISREVLVEIRELLPGERIHSMEEKDLAGWLSQADLVIAATSDRQLNHEISSYCHQHKILVNVIDAPEECSFLFPSLVKRGEISIGINTGGQSPIVSSRIRREIEKAVPDYYEEITAQLGQLRQYVKEHISSQEQRKAILKEAAGRAFSLERPLSPEEIRDITSLFSCKLS